MHPTTDESHNDRTERTAEPAPDDALTEEANTPASTAEGETAPQHSGRERLGDEPDTDRYNQTESVGCPYCTWRGANNKLPFHLTECPGVEQ